MARRMVKEEDNTMEREKCRCKNASGRRVRRGRPRLGTRGGKHGSPSVQGNSPSRSEWLPLDMRTTPPAAMPAFRGFEESSSDGVVNLHPPSYFLLFSFISFPPFLFLYSPFSTKINPTDFRLYTGCECNADPTRHDLKINSFLHFSFFHFLTVVYYSE